MKLHRTEYGAWSLTDLSTGNVGLVLQAPSHCGQHALPHPHAPVLRRRGRYRRLFRLRHLDNLLPGGHNGALLPLKTVRLRYLWFRATRNLDNQRLLCAQTTVFGVGMMEPIVFTPRLKLTLVTTAARGSLELEWLHELRSNQKAMWWR